VPKLNPGFLIHYHGHARQRMAKRQISDAEVRQILQAGAHRLDGIGDGGADKWATWGNINSRTIEVIWWELANGEVQVVLVKTVIDKQKGW
jgi:hypothetical protein